MGWIADSFKALADIRASPGGDKLSEDCCHVLALIVAMQDPKIESAIEYAKTLGTFNEIDRSRQYAGRYSNEILKRNDDLLFQKLREYEERDFRHKLILAVIGLGNTALWFVMWYFH